jgi:hypothetical protein
MPLLRSHLGLRARLLIKTKRDEYVESQKDNHLERQSSSFGFGTSRRRQSAAWPASIRTMLYVPQRVLSKRKGRSKPAGFVPSHGTRKREERQRNEHPQRHQKGRQRNARISTIARSGPQRPDRVPENALSVEPLFVPQYFQRLLLKDSEAGEPAGHLGKCGSENYGQQGRFPVKGIVGVQ